MFKVSYLWRGLPGHPLHPPLTDGTIGTYTVATALAFADVLGWSDNAAAEGAGGWRCSSVSPSRCRRH